MKLKIKDSYPLIVLVFSLSLALTNPIIREDDVLRVGWAIIHTIICVGYITGLFILKEIRKLYVLVSNDEIIFSYDMERIREWAFNMDCMFEDCIYLSHEQFNKAIRTHLEKLIKFVGRWIPPEMRDQREEEKQ